MERGREALTTLMPTVRRTATKSQGRTRLELLGQRCLRPGKVLQCLVDSWHTRHGALRAEEEAAHQGVHRPHQLPAAQQYEEELGYWAHMTVHVLVNCMCTSTQGYARV
jgi:hypothetical protein